MIATIWICPRAVLEALGRHILQSPSEKGGILAQYVLYLYLLNPQPSLCFQHRDTQQTLTVLERLDLDTEKPTAEETAKKFGFEDDFYSGNISWWQKTKPKIWSTFDEPYSSSLAKVQSVQSLTSLGNGQKCHYKQGVTVTSHFYCKVDPIEAKKVSV